LAKSFDSNRDGFCGKRVARELPVE
jgi:S1-C subfamily serine protease